MWKASAPVVVGVDGSDAAVIARFLAANKDESVQLTAVGSGRDVVQIIGPHSHPLFTHGDCSVLIVQ
jgi:hypothetical protein